ncbi:MAG: PEGA domain-containing protein [Myxococcales bacterium]|nr:PEGA domain-containing protein [Myxococcales bacterium]
MLRLGRMKTWLGPCLGLVVLAQGAQAGGKAWGAEKLAVLILGTSEADADLAENVTEVVIAHVARHGTFELAGKEEFQARLGMDSEVRGQACLESMSCLSRAAVSLGVRRIVSGSVGVRGKQFLFSLALNNVESAQVENRVFRLIEGDVQALIRAVQSGTAELFKPRVEPGRVEVKSMPEGARVSIDNAYLGITPLISGTLLPGPHRVRVEADQRFSWTSTVEVLPGQDLGINLTEENLPRRRQFPGQVAYATGALSLAALASGGFFGVLSQVSTSGDTRLEHQDSLDERARFADIATVSLITAGGLALLSLGTFILYRDDIFGRDEDVKN